MDVRRRQERIEEPSDVHAGLQGEPILPGRGLTDGPVIVTRYRHADGRRDDESSTERVIAKREPKILEGLVVRSRVKRPERLAAGRVPLRVVDEPAELDVTRIIGDGELRGDVRQPRGERELVRESVLEVDDGKMRAGWDETLPPGAVAPEMATETDVLEDDRQARFAIDRNPGRLRGRTGSARQAHDCGQEHERRSPGARAAQSELGVLPGLLLVERTASAIVIRYSVDRLGALMRYRHCRAASFASGLVSL